MTSIEYKTLKAAIEDIETAHNAHYQSSEIVRAQLGLLGRMVDFMRKRSEERDDVVPT